MKVVDWISEEASADKETAIGGMGGWFGTKPGEGEEHWNAGHRWKDYIEALREEFRPYAEAIRESVLERGIRYTGEDHQNRDDGVPLFEDGKVGSFTWRAWGDIMAAIWSEKENKNYTYMDFYM